MKKKIRVLIVDDSAFVRGTMAKLLDDDPDIEVMGFAANPFIAVKKIEKETPDVITLDIEMPEMDGLTFLQKIMSQHPIPVVIISTLTAKGTITAIKALEYGAVEVLPKPKINTKKLLEESAFTFREAVKAAAQANVSKKRHSQLRSIPKYTSDVSVVKKAKVRSSMLQTTENVVAIGASTGGTDAIRKTLEMMPVNCPGIVIVQHMPELFTRQFADRLNSSCSIVVKEAETGDSVLRGQALIAPGNKHMLLKRSGARYYVNLIDGPLVNRHKPSVDVLFRSVARYAGRNSIGVLMTGMGDDGARGLLEMRESGATTLAQDEDSCVVFGMPKEAIKLGAASNIVALGKITDEILDVSQHVHKV